MLSNAPASAWKAAELLEQASRLAHARGFSQGLNPAQWSALRYIARAPAPERTVTAFALHRATTRGTASQTVAALVRKGYVERIEVAEDRRSHRLELTASGAALLAVDPIGALVRGIERLEEGHRAALADALAALLDSEFEDGAVDTAAE